VYSNQLTRVDFFRNKLWTTFRNETNATTNNWKKFHSKLSEFCAVWKPHLDFLSETISVTLCPEQWITGFIWNGTTNLELLLIQLYYFFCSYISIHICVYDSDQTICGPNFVFFNVRVQLYCCPNVVIFILGTFGDQRYPAKNNK
jgi:hypothetical protein